MRAAARLFVTLGVLAGLAASAASAQHAQTRQGFWIGFGFGYGTAGLSSDAISGAGREGGGSGYIKLGGTLKKNLLLGGEVNAWTKSEGGGTVTLGNVSAAAYVYPAPETGFFLKGGVGFADLRASNSGTATATGFGFVGGIGYDIRVGKNISLTPVANFFWGGDGDLKESGTTLDTGYKHNVFDFGLGITFH